MLLVERVRPSLSKVDLLSLRFGTRAVAHPDVVEIGAWCAWTRCYSELKYEIHGFSRFESTILFKLAQSLINSSVSVWYPLSLSWVGAYNSSYRIETYDLVDQVEGFTLVRIYDLLDLIKSSLSQDGAQAPRPGRKFLELGRTSFVSLIKSKVSQARLEFIVFYQVRPTTPSRSPPYL